MFQGCHCLIKEKLSYPYEFFRGPKFGHAIAYAKWSADGVRDFWTLWVLFLSAFAAWPHQPHRECDSGQILRQGLMWTWPRCVGRARRSVRSKKLLSICRGSKLTTNQKRKIKLQAVLCPGRIQVGIIQHTRPVVTSGNTCGKHMETMTHLLCVVAIDTCVYTLRENIIVEALDTVGSFGKDLSTITRQNLFWRLPQNDPVAFHSPIEEKKYMNK